MQAATLHELLTALADAVPALPGARCVSERDLFDRAALKGHGTDRRLAVGVCRACSALTACTQWVDALPPSARPHGIVAGWLVRFDRRRVFR
ncbi:MAG: hypothetical protein ABWY20_20695 [Mycobacterium sp.]